MLNKDGMCELIGIKYIDLDCSKFPEIQVKISITTLEIIEKIGIKNVPELIKKSI